MPISRKFNSPRTSKSKLSTTRTSSFNDGPIVYGSKVPGQFLDDLANGRDSVDFVVVGDSNTGSAIADMWGFHNGIQQALFVRGYNYYGTPIVPQMVGNNNDLAPMFWRGGVNIFNSNQITVTAINANGNFTCNSRTLFVGEVVTISGNAANGGITGYTAPGPKAYYIISVNANPATSFTLSETKNGTAITTTAGTGAGLTFVDGALLKGSIYGNSTAYANWTPSVNFTRYGSNTATPDGRDTWAYMMPNSGEYRQTFGLGIDSNHPLAGTNQTVYYRLRYGTFTASGGRFCPQVYASSPATEMFSPRVEVSTQGANYSYSVWEQSFQTLGTATGYRGAWSCDGLGAGPNRSVGPVAIHSQSMYRRSKGWAVHSHAYLGGFSTDNIAAVIEGAASGGQLALLLQEIRERQIAAGGSGRVIVAFQGGTNTNVEQGPETGAKWTTSAQRVWNAYKAVWLSLGYPLSDLAFIGWVTHPTNTTDTSAAAPTGNMIEVRNAANRLPANLGAPDMTIIDIKKMMPYEALLIGNGDISSTVTAPALPAALVGIGRPYFQQIGTGAQGWPTSTAPEFYAHLSGGKANANGTQWHPTDGYSLISGMIIDQLRNLSAT